MTIGYAYVRSSPWTPTERMAGKHGEALPQLAVEVGAPDLLEQDRVGSPKNGEPLLGDVADDPDREAGTGERLAPDHALGQAELLADPAHLVLEEKAQRLDELHPHVRRQAADVVVRLDERGDAVLASARLDDVGVERSLDEEADVAEVARLLLEDADELLADDLALLLRIGDAGEPREEALLRLHVDERDVEVAAERLDDLLGLVLAQQAVVDEDARELVADGLVHEERGDCRVDATRERAEHALRADRGADSRDLLLDDRSGRPRRRRAGDLVEEVLEDVLPVRRMHDLGVELDAVQPPCPILEGGDRRRRRAGRDLRPRRWSRHRVAMAHPHGLLGREVVEELGVVRLELGLAELGRSGALDGAAEVARHELHAVTDAERRDPEREDLGVEVRRAIGVHRGGAAGEDQRRRVSRRDLRGRQSVSDELRVHPRLAHTTRDQLAVLPAEVDDEDGTFFRCGLGSRKRNDLRHLSAGSSGRPS